MKTPKTLQTQRVKPKGTFKKLHAATRGFLRRKQRAATTANPSDISEVSGLGAMGALGVILLLHVAAIAGIYLHNRYSEENELQASAPSIQSDQPPKPITGLRQEIVNKGDSYESIAAKHEIEVEALREVNESKPLKAGWYINIPNPKRPAREAVASTPIEAVDPIRPQERPMIQTSDNDLHPGTRPGELVEINPNPVAPEPTQDAILIKPRRSVNEPDPSPAGTSASRKHVIESGQTLWGISQKYKVSVAAIERANPGVNANTLKIGGTLVIPAP